MQRKTMRGLMVVVIAVLVSGSMAMAQDDDISLPKPKGNLRYSITVSKFENKAGYRGKWDIGDGFGAILTDALQQSGWFIVLGEKDMRQEAMAEQDFGASGRTAGGKKKPKVGRMTPAQLLVKGVITHVQNDTAGGRGGIRIRGIRVGGSGGKAEVNITMYLVDSATGQVKASTKVVGQSARRGLSLGYHGSQLGGLTGDLAGFKNDNVGKACEHAVAQGAKFLIGQLEGIAWEASIMLVKGDKIIMNRGTREGVEVGNTFVVGGVEELVDEDTGEVLDSEMTEVATVETTSVKEKIAYLKVVGDGGKIEKGMSVFKR